MDVEKATYFASNDYNERDVYKIMQNKRIHTFLIQTQRTVVTSKQMASESIPKIVGCMIQHASPYSPQPPTLKDNIHQEIEEIHQAINIKMELFINIKAKPVQKLQKEK